MASGPVADSSALFAEAKPLVSRALELLRSSAMRDAPIPTDVAPLLDSLRLLAVAHARESDVDYLLLLPLLVMPQMTAVHSPPKWPPHRVLEAAWAAVSSVTGRVGWLAMLRSRDRWAGIAQRALVTVTGALESKGAVSEEACVAACDALHGVFDAVALPPGNSPSPATPLYGGDGPAHAPDPLLSSIGFLGHACACFTRMLDPPAGTSPLGRPARLAALRGISAVVRCVSWYRPALLPHHPAPQLTAVIPPALPSFLPGIVACLVRTILHGVTVSPQASDTVGDDSGWVVTPSGRGGVAAAAVEGLVHVLVWGVSDALQGSCLAVACASASPVPPPLGAPLSAAWWVDTVSHLRPALTRVCDCLQSVAMQASHSGEGSALATASRAFFSHVALRCSTLFGEDSALVTRALDVVVQSSPALLAMQPGPQVDAWGHRATARLQHWMRSLVSPSAAASLASWVQTAQMAAAYLSVCRGGSVGDTAHTSDGVPAWMHAAAMVAGREMAAEAPLVRAGSVSPTNPWVDACPALSSLTSALDPLMTAWVAGAIASGADTERWRRVVDDLLIGDRAVGGVSSSAAARLCVASAAHFQALSQQAALVLGWPLPAQSSISSAHHGPHVPALQPSVAALGALYCCARMLAALHRILVDEGPREQQRAAGAALAVASRRLIAAVAVRPGDVLHGAAAAARSCTVPAHVLASVQASLLSNRWSEAVTTVYGLAQLRPAFATDAAGTTPVDDVVEGLGACCAVIVLRCALSPEALPSANTLAAAVHASSSPPVTGGAPLGAPSEWVSVAIAVTCVSLATVLGRQAAAVVHDVNRLLLPMLHSGMPAARHHALAALSGLRDALHSMPTAWAALLPLPIPLALRSAFPPAIADTRLPLAGADTDQAVSASGPWSVVLGHPAPLPSALVPLVAGSSQAMLQHVASSPLDATSVAVMRSLLSALQQRTLAAAASHGASAIADAAAKQVVAWLQSAVTPVSSLLASGGARPALPPLPIEAAGAGGSLSSPVVVAAEGGFHEYGLLEVAESELDHEHDGDRDAAGEARSSSVTSRHARPLLQSARAGAGAQWRASRTSAAQAPALELASIVSLAPAAAAAVAASSASRYTGPTLLDADLAAAVASTPSPFGAPSPVPAAWGVDSRTVSSTAAAWLPATPITAAPMPPDPSAPALARGSEIRVGAGLPVLLARLSARLAQASHLAAHTGTPLASARSLTSRALRLPSPVSPVAGVAGGGPRTRDAQVPAAISRLPHLTPAGRDAVVSLARSTFPLLSAAAGAIRTPTAVANSAALRSASSAFQACAGALTTLATSAVALARHPNELYPLLADAWDALTAVLPAADAVLVTPDMLPAEMTVLDAVLLTTSSALSQAAPALHRHLSSAPQAALLLGVPVAALSSCPPSALAPQRAAPAATPTSVSNDQGALTAAVAFLHLRRARITSRGSHTAAPATLHDMTTLTHSEHPFHLPAAALTMHAAAIALVVALASPPRLSSGGGAAAPVAAWGAACGDFLRPRFNEHIWPRLRSLLAAAVHASRWVAAATGGGSAVRSRAALLPAALLRLFQSAFDAVDALARPLVCISRVDEAEPSSAPQPAVSACPATPMPTTTIVSLPPALARKQVTDANEPTWITLRPPLLSAHAVDALSLCSLTMAHLSRATSAAAPPVADTGGVSAPSPPAHAAEESIPLSIPRWAAAVRAAVASLQAWCDPVGGVTPAVAVAAVPM